MLIDPRARPAGILRGFAVILALCAAAVIGVAYWQHLNSTTLGAFAGGLIGSALLCGAMSIFGRPPKEK